MGELIKFIGTICPITGDNVVDTFIFTIITGISFIFAWKLTGCIADFTDIYNSSSMSFFHWAIRGVLFFLLLTIVLGIINLVHWIGSWPWWGYLVFGFVIAIMIAGIVLIIVLGKKRRSKKKEANKSYEGK